MEALSPAAPPQAAPGLRSDQPNCPRRSKGLKVHLLNGYSAGGNLPQPLEANPTCSTIAAQGHQVHLARSCMLLRNKPCQGYAFRCRKTVPLHCLLAASCLRPTLVWKSWQS